MFTRQVTIPLKASCSAELARTIESEILPLLRQQSGFPESVVSIAHKRMVVEGIPKVETFTLSNVVAKAA